MVEFRPRGGVLVAETVNSAARRSAHLLLRAVPNRSSPFSIICSQDLHLLRLDLAASMM